MKDKKQSCETGDFVGIAGALGGILFVTILMILIFAKESLVLVLSPLIWGFVTLGVFLGFFQYLALKKKK